MCQGHSCNCLSGQSALDDAQSYQRPNHGTKHFRQAQRDQNLRKSFAGLESAKVNADDDHDQYEEDSSASAAAAAISDLFHGFLAIGTLGSEHPSSTPTFSISVENITEKEDEVTENELKLINDELEKVLLGAETNKDINDDSSSGRNSHVSTGRSSHGSIITLSGKEGTESSSAVCPLQGYLFGSAIEMSETTTNNPKKEHRTSLGELFQRSKLAEENNSGGNSKSERDDKREADHRSAMNLMKKKLKKRMLLASSRNSTSPPVDSASAETKLHKVKLKYINEQNPHFQFSAVYSIVIF